MAASELNKASAKLKNRISSQIQAMALLAPIFYQSCHVNCQMSHDFVEQ